MRRKPGEDGIFEEVQVSEKQRLTENQCRDCDVHGISDEAVGAIDDQVTCWQNGGRCSYALEGKAGEGFEDHGDADGHEQSSDDAEGNKTEQRWAKMPVSDPPRDESSYGSRSQEEKGGCSEDGGGASGFVVRFPWVLHLLRV